MLAVLTCVYEGHDLRLVAAAALICATACLAAFGFHLRSLRTRDGMRWAWTGFSGLAAGAGVWATHFVAMLAYQPHLPVGYDPVGTAASLAISVGGMLLGFGLPVLARNRAGQLAGGAVTGATVGAMHYTGILAMRAQAQMVWEPVYLTASIVLGVVLAMLAFGARGRLRGPRALFVPAVILVLAICSLHFTGMTALTLAPDPTLAPPAEAMGRGKLAVAAGGLAVLILAAAGSLIWMERLGRRSTLKSVRSALDVVPAGLAFFDPAGRLTAWNHAFADLMDGCGRPPATGVRRERFVEAALLAGWRPVESPDAVERWNAHVDGASVPPSELRLPDGRWMRHEAFTTHDGGGVTVMTDVTEQRETARTLAEARDAAEAANRAKTEFLANMSHEIRTPLNGVLGVADILMRSPLSAKQQELVGVIQASGSLLNALLNDLLDLARIEAGAVELRPERASLGEVVRSARDLFQARADELGLALAAEVDPACETDVLCDAVRLRQVLGNLLSNALKFTDEGRVTLRVVRSGARVRFEVEDTGAGFDEASRATMFQRFRQGDNTSTRRHGGAGLGLAICDEYVRLMGGELDCASRPGEGSVFRFELDLPALEPAAPAGAVEDEAPEPVPGEGFRVLVVDDNAVNRQVLQLILESAGIDCESVENGQEAVDAVARGAFDAILMDIQMPVMDGLEATRRIRAWEEAQARQRAPIYIVSANCLPEHVDAGRVAGADGHLNKPVSVAELLGVLAPHVAEARKAA
ncbi:ATP-binding protein [Phenylobacterium sp.]|uniref:ATP-binding protein n=1 Tax=Phenylobacterium sp. TaxID=1871053 RepID=UPI0028115922|nr:MHYT domain-containing protein [Phenylobacterium sp.]